MAIFKCKICGGNVRFAPDATVGVCDSCGAKQMLQKTNNDVMHGIGKVVGGAAPAPAPVSAQPTAAPVASVGVLLKRAFMFLEDGEWQKAEAFCEQVLNRDPENAYAYLGELLAELHVKKPNDLKNHMSPFDQLANYKKAMRFGDNNLKNSLAACAKHTNDRIGQARMEMNYNNAVNAMNTANSEGAYKNAAEAFRDISGYKDADEKMAACQKKAEEEKVKEERKKKKKSKKYTIIVFSFLACVAIGVLLPSVIIPNAKYHKAVALMKDGKYDEAYAEFEKLQWYKDSETQLYEVRYQEAIALMNSGKYIEALDLFYYLRHDSYNRDGLEDTCEECKRRFVTDLLEKQVTAFPNLKDVKKGNTIKFGACFNDGIIYDQGVYPEEIEWQVLDVKDGKALIISKHEFHEHPYNEKEEDVTWETCTLRKWLNDDFFNEIFEEKFQERIVTTTVPADKNPTYNTNPGKVTNDKVFLLSVAEVEKYFPTDESRAEYDGCWLRTPGSDQVHAAVFELAHDSICIWWGSTVDNAYVDFCPAMWISLE